MLPGRILSETPLDNVTAEIFQARRGVVIIAGPPASGKTSLRLQLSRLAASTLSASDLTIDLGPARSKGISAVDEIRLASRMGAAVISAGEDLATLEINMLFAAALRRLIIIEAALPDTGVALESLRSTHKLAGGVIAESLHLLISPRVVRLLCPGCKSIDMDHFRNFNDRGDVQPARFRPIGCPSCKGEGYRGRVTLVQTCGVTDEMRKLLRHGAEHGQVLTAAQAGGGLAGFSDIADKLLGPGLLSSEERLKLSGYHAAAAVA